MPLSTWTICVIFHWLWDHEYSVFRVLARRVRIPSSPYLRLSMSCMLRSLVSIFMLLSPASTWYSYLKPVRFRLIAYFSWHCQLFIRSVDVCLLTWSFLRVLTPVLLFVCIFYDDDFRLSPFCVKCWPHHQNLIYAHSSADVQSSDSSVDVPSLSLRSCSFVHSPVLQRV